MAQSAKISQKQFATIAAQLYLKLFLRPIDGFVAQFDPEPEPTDCVALAKFIEAAQQIYTRDCPIASAAVLPFLTIRDSDPARFVRRIQAEINSGAIVTGTASRLEWVTWRWVRIYICTLKFDVPKPKLLLTFGPVSEQSIPDLQE